MKIKKISGLLLISAALFIVGCAQKGVVKKEDVLAPTTSQKLAEDQKNATSQTNAASTAITNSDSGSLSKGLAIAGTSAEGVTTGGISTAGQNKTTAQHSSPVAVYFGFDAYVLTNESRNTLQTNFKMFESKPAIQIEGHCDERGSSEYNLALGEKRAKVAQKYLVTLGYPADKISTISYGKEHPADKGSDEVAWAKNRRDEFKIVK